MKKVTKRMAATGAKKAIVEATIKKLKDKGISHPTTKPPATKLLKFSLDIGGPQDASVVNGVEIKLIRDKAVLGTVRITESAVSFTKANGKLEGQYVPYAVLDEFAKLRSIYLKFGVTK